MSDFEYGNTRLRVRAGHWLAADDYETLLRSSSIDGLLGSLAEHDYADAIERVVGRHSGLRRLDEAIGWHLTGQLSDVVSFYSDAAAQRLRDHLQRWDIRNVRTVLRGLGQRSAERPATDMLIAAGTLDAAALDELAGQRDVRAAIDLLSVWRAPSPIVVRRLRAALPHFTQTGDIQILDDALDRALGDFVEQVASEDDAVTDLLQREIDRINLMSAVRVRTERIATGRSDGLLPIAGGRVPERHWSDLVHIDDAAVPVETLDPLLPRGWGSRLRTWVDANDRRALERGIESEIARAAVRRFRTGDPLGLDVPLGYIGQQEAEATNLRFVGRTIVFELSRDEAMSNLIGVS